MRFSIQSPDEQLSPRAETERAFTSVWYHRSDALGPDRRARRARAQPQERGRRDAARPADRDHRPVGIAASPPWPSTPSTPRASAAMSSRCPPTRGSSWARWRSRTSTRSTGCRRPSASTRRAPRRTRARRSAPSPRSTTTCACSSRAPAACTARSAVARSSARRSSRSSTRSTTLPEGTRLMLLAPLVRGSQGRAREAAAGAKQAGFVRVRVDGELRDLDEDIKLDKKYKHTIEVVVDRLVVRQADDDGNPRPDASRMADSIETALRLSEGSCSSTCPTRHRRSRTASTARSTPALSTEARSRSWRRGTSASTRPTAPVRTAPGSARGWRSTLTWCSPNESCRFDEGAIAALAADGRHGVWFAKILEAVAEHYDFGIDGAVATSRETRADRHVRQRRRAGRGASTRLATGTSTPSRPPSRAWCRTWRGATGRRARSRQGRDRALHDDQAVPDLRGHAAEARIAVGDCRRAEHHPDDRACR